MAQVAVVLRGPSGVGKSTVSAALLQRLPAPMVLLSQDSLISAINAGEEMRRQLACAVAAGGAEACLDAGSSAVIDGGFHWHPESEWVAAVRAACERHGARLLVIRLVATLETVLTRNHSRLSPTADERIARYYEQYERQAVHPTETVIGTEGTTVADLADSITSLARVP